MYWVLLVYKECFFLGKFVCVFFCFVENVVFEMVDIMESSFSIFGNLVSSCVIIFSEIVEVVEVFIEVFKFVFWWELKDCFIIGIFWSLLKEIVCEMVGFFKFEEFGVKIEFLYFIG